MLLLEFEWREVIPAEVPLPCVLSLFRKKNEPLQTLQMETYLDVLPPTKDGYTFANLGSVPAVPMARITSIEEREQVPSAGLFK